MATLRQILLDTGFFADEGGTKTLHHKSASGTVCLRFDPFDGLIGVDVVGRPGTSSATLSDEQKSVIDDAVAVAKDAVRRAESAADVAREALDDVERIADELRGDA